MDLYSIIFPACSCESFCAAAPSMDPRSRAPSASRRRSPPPGRTSSPAPPPPPATASTSASSYRAAPNGSTPVARGPYSGGGEPRPHHGRPRRQAGQDRRPPHQRHRRRPQQRRLRVLHHPQAARLHRRLPPLPASIQAQRLEPARRLAVQQRPASAHWKPPRAARTRPPRRRAVRNGHGRGEAAPGQKGLRGAADGGGGEAAVDRETAARDAQRRVCAQIRPGWCIRRQSFASTGADTPSRKHCRSLPHIPPTASPTLPSPPSSLATGPTNSRSPPQTRCTSSLPSKCTRTR